MKELMQSEDYTPAFLKHFKEGERLFREADNQPDSKGGKAALAVCATALEMHQWSEEAKALADIFAILDEKGRSAVLPIIAFRLSEIVILTRRTMSVYDDRSEATETEAQHLHTDAGRFIKAVQSAHSLALAAGG